jgi:hypothetical protein
MESRRYSTSNVPGSVASPAAASFRSRSQSMAQPVSSESPVSPPSGTAETLEQKIARVMAGINNPAMKYTPSIPSPSLSNLSSPISARRYGSAPARIVRPPELTESSDEPPLQQNEDTSGRNAPATVQPTSSFANSVARVDAPPVPAPFLPGAASTISQNSSAPLGLQKISVPPIATAPPRPLPVNVARPLTPGAYPPAPRLVPTATLGASVVPANLQPVTGAPVPRPPMLNLRPVTPLQLHIPPAPAASPRSPAGPASGSAGHSSAAPAVTPMQRAASPAPASGASLQALSPSNETKIPFSFAPEPSPAAAPAAPPTLRGGSPRLAHRPAEEPMQQRPAEGAAAAPSPDKEAAPVSSSSPPATADPVPKKKWSISQLFREVALDEKGNPLKTVDSPEPVTAKRTNGAHGLLIVCNAFLLISLFVVCR